MPMRAMEQPWSHDTRMIECRRPPVFAATAGPNNELI